MICYKDRTYCSALCKNKEGCYRGFTQKDRASADLWAIQCGMVSPDGIPEPRVAYSDFSKRCDDYEAA